MKIHPQKWMEKIPLSNIKHDIRNAESTMGILIDERYFSIIAIFALCPPVLKQLIDLTNSEEIP
ncbi:MAG: hypothetical protein ACFFAJ_15130 [Candidatus Hodarchaeota archaeon]